MMVPCLCASPRGHPGAELAARDPSVGRPSVGRPSVDPAEDRPGATPSVRPPSAGLPAEDRPGAGLAASQAFSTCSPCELIHFVNELERS